MSSKRRHRYITAWKQYLRQHSLQKWLFILALIALLFPWSQIGIPSGHNIWIRRGSTIIFLGLLITMMWRVRNRYYELGEQSFEQTLQQKYGLDEETAKNIADDAREAVGDAPMED